MAEDVEVTQEKPSNACCAALKKKHAKLLEKYSKVEELKNKFRNCTALVQEKYDLIEKENEGLKKALAELEVQANAWKDEKEKESGVRIDLENQVSALNEEVRMLKQNGKSASQEADKQLQECLNVAQKEIKQLKELVNKEKGRTALEKRNAEVEKKKANEALKQLEMGNKKISEAQNVANVERKKAEEYKLSVDKLNMKIDAMKSNIALEKSKSEAADKKVEAAKQKAIRETERADLAVAKTEEQREIAEMNLKKAIFEKGRADDLNQKLEEARNRAKNVESHNRMCSRKSVSIQAGESNTGRNGESPIDVHTGMLKNNAQLSKLMEKMLFEKEHNIVREKKRADSEKKKAKKHKEVAEAHKKMAIEQKHRADQLSKELECYKLRLEEKQKELQELVSYRTCVDNLPLRKSDIVSESDTIKLLKKQLKLEKMLVKHAKKVSKVEVVRNDMLHQELFRLKQECLQFQQRLSILDETFIRGGEGIHQLEKIGNQTSETLCSDGYHSQLISGIDSRLDPPYRGSNHKMLQSSAINSSSASFSDRPLVGSQERGTLSVTTSAKPGEDMSNFNATISKLSDKAQIKYNEHAVAKTDKTIRSPIKEDANGRRVGNHERKRISDAVVSIEKLNSKGGKLHQKVSEKICFLHDMLNVQKDDHKEDNLKENSCGRLARPCKRRKTSCDGRRAVHNLQDSGDQKSPFDSDLDRSESCRCTSSPGFNVTKLDGHSKDGINNTLDDQCIPQDFDEMAAYDPMKLLDLDNADEENSYRSAIAMPLSPILPDIEFPGDEKLQAVHPEMLVDKRSQEGLSSSRDELVSASSFHTIDTDKTDLVLNGIGSSKLHRKNDSVGFLKHTDSVRAINTHSHQIRVSYGSFGIKELSYPANHETNMPCEKRVAASRGAPLKYFVVSSDNRDNHSILRILHAISNYMPQLPFLHSAEIFIQSILLALLKCEDLSMKEKVCVFFSLILQGISEVGPRNMTSVSSDVLGHSFDSAALHILSALSEPDLRRIFMQSCHLFELLDVIEDFLLHRKVFVQADISAGHDAIPSSKINLDMNGTTTMLSEIVAPAHLLVAGGSLLASLCSAFDYTDFVCEISCNIITMQFDPAVMLAVLHAFAHVCGARYFSLQQYSVAMTVVKSLVQLLEKQSNSTPFSPSIAADLSKICPCSTNCPFSEGAVSMEDVALLLLENLQKHGQSKSCPQDSLELVNLLVPRVESHEERTERFSGSRDCVSLSSKSDENLCAFIDTLSLVELLASFMSWDWTFDNIVDQVCEYLESHLMEGFAAAVTTLLGQLGRLGVSASGYDDPRVKKLRGRLSAFVCPIAFSKLPLPVQLAIINALFDLTPIKFEEILEDKVEIPAVRSQSFPASFIREWFFLLSNEQQSLLRLHRAASESNCLPPR